ncbi:MAG: hypothetical protein HYX74_09755 [Acidobacteria bacterium]|nr:hypothetical protein [Acidobacteriota bacterium]
MHASIVPENKWLASTQRCEIQEGAFALLFDERFLTSLDEEDLRAVVAHELGHIWIFTHHPFLQTEVGANEKAMLVVSRESLEKAYEKVWKHVGKQGDLPRFPEE